MVYLPGRRHGSIGILGIAAVLCLSCGRDPVERHEPVRIALQNDVFSLPFLAAEELGNFRQQGLSTERVSIGKPTETYNSFIEGRIDIFSPVPVQDLLRVEGKTPGQFKMFLPLKMMYSEDESYILTMKGSEITRIEHLMGRIILVLSEEDAGYLKCILDQAGIRADLDIVTDPETLREKAKAFVRGRPHAAFVAGVRSQLRYRPGLASFNVGNLFQTCGNVHISTRCAVVSSKFLQKHPDQFVKLWKALVEVLEIFPGSSTQDSLASDDTPPDGVPATEGRSEEDSTESDKAVPHDAMQKLADYIHDYDEFPEDISDVRDSKSRGSIGPLEMLLDRLGWDAGRVEEVSHISWHLADSSLTLGELQQLADDLYGRGEIENKVDVEDLILTEEKISQLWPGQASNDISYQAGSSPQGE